MSKRIIGIASHLFDNEYREKLSEAAAQYDFDIISLNGNGIERIGECEIIFGAVPPKMLGGAACLKWLACSFAGVEKYIDTNLYHSDNVLLTNSSGAYGITIAESMIAGILVLFRRFDQYFFNQQNREWGSPMPVRSIYGSRITVVGMGDIGACFGERAAALGAYVTGVRKSVIPKPFWLARQFTSERLDEALTEADVVALCVPSTAETTHIIDAGRIALMNSRTVIVNVGRGSAIDQDALVPALNEGLIGGAFLDVTEPEPLPPSHPLWTAKNCIITPHVSGNTTFMLTRERITGIFFENLRLYAEGKPLLHIVDRKRGY